MNGLVTSDQSAGSCTTGGRAGTIQLLASTDVAIGTTGAVTANGNPCSGGNVTVTAGADVTLAPGALVSATQGVPSDPAGSGAPAGTTGGTIAITSGGDVSAAGGSTITVSAGRRPAGSIDIRAPNGTIALNGQVLSQQGGLFGTGGNQPPGGGPINVVAGCTLTVGGTVSSRGTDPGADLVHLEGCDVTISGLVESTGAGHAPPVGSHCRDADGKPGNSTGCVEVVAHGTLTVTGEISADLCCSGGTGGTSWIDLFAAGDVSIIRAALPYAVHANEETGTGGSGSQGGVVTVKSVSGSVSTTGPAISANGVGGGGDGGVVVVESGGTTTVAFGAASLQARGGTSGNLPSGGSINARSFNGQVTGVAPGELNTAATTAISGTVTLQGCTPPPGVGYAGAVTGTLTIVPAACGGNPTLPTYIGPLAPCPVCTPGSITIVKVSEPEGPTTFTFNASWLPPATPLTPTTFVLNDDGDPANGTPDTQSFLGLAAGQYTFTENPVEGFAIDITCTVVAPRVGDAVNGVTVTLTPGQNVICVFRNVQQGSVTIVKDSVPDSAAAFDFSVTPDSVTPSTFTVDDDGSPMPFPNSQVLAGVVTGTIYTVTETPASGFTLAAIDCVGGQTVNDLPNNQVAISFSAGDEIVCTFVNTSPPPEPPELLPEAVVVSAGGLALTGSDAPRWVLPASSRWCSGSAWCSRAAAAAGPSATGRSSRAVRRGPQTTTSGRVVAISSRDKRREPRRARPLRAA